MTNLISAPAISRIIHSHTSIPKANATGWSEGFYVVGFGGFSVEVGYQDTDIEVVESNLSYIADTLNNHGSQKYSAKVETNNGSLKVVVKPRSEEKTQEDRMEELAEESPFAVTKQEVNKVLRNGCYPYTDKPTERAAGYVIARAEAPNDRLVRVTYKDHPHTMYALVVGGREQYFKDSVKLYADKLRAAGFSVAIEGDYESVLVGVPGEFPSEDDPQEVKEALMALREAVEDDDPSYMTRRAGNLSIFVIYEDPYKNQTRRLEVFWKGGSYASYGRSGGSRSEFHNLDLMLRFIRSELAA